MHLVHFSSEKKISEKKICVQVSSNICITKCCWLFIVINEKHKLLMKQKTFFLMNEMPLVFH